MKIEQTLNEGSNAFTGYGDGYVEVGGKRHAASLVVSAKTLLEGWAGGSIEQLTEAQVAYETDGIVFVMGPNTGLPVEPKPPARKPSAQTGQTQTTQNSSDKAPAAKE